ncbi:transporter [Crenothrix sp.]|uniref:transporter n=1 Tax=Crenothrix sp. TaxID=3100433 RepID=UPI00374CAA96
MNNNKLVSRQIGRCLVVTAVSLVFMDNSVAAHKHKRKPSHSTQALLQEVKQRDALIKNLLLRVEALENSRNPLSAPHHPQQEQLATNTTLPPQQAAPAATQTQADKTNSSPKPKAAAEAPGQFSVDEQAAQRALERTLAKSGALLVPTWSLDTDLNFDFAHSERQIARIAKIGNDNITDLAKVRRNTFTPSVAFRLGLPFESQLEFSLPYSFIDQSTIPVIQGQVGERKASGSGLGDIQIGLAKTLLREEQWWPDLIARVSWNTDSGDATDGDVGLGGGVHRVTGSLTALKRQDPLAFSFNARYTKAFTKKDYFPGVNGSYNPGDTLAFSIGAQLAASADTSLSIALDQSFISNTELGSQTIAGSNQNIGLLSIGASSIVSRNLFVNLTVGMGLTDDAADYTAGITLSNRTNLKPYLGLN